MMKDYDLIFGKIEARLPYKLTFGFVKLSRLRQTGFDLQPSLLHLHLVSDCSA